MSRGCIQRNHAKKRAWRLYGLNLDNADLAQLASRVQAGDARLIHQQSGDRDVLELDIKQRPTRVIYDRTNGQILTFLPLLEAGTGGA